MSLPPRPFFGRAPGPSRPPPDRPRFWSDGAPIGTLPTGWRLHGARPITPALHLFDIDDRDGRQSWFADGDGRLLAQRADLLPTAAIAALRGHVLADAPIEVHEQGHRVWLDRDFMVDIVLDPLLDSDSGLLVRDASGDARPVRHPDGAPIAALHPGWTARLAFTGFAPLLVVDLSHVDGLRAVWYIDEAGRLLGSMLHALSQEMLGRVAAYGERRAAWPQDRMDHDLTGYGLLSGVILAQTEPMLPPRRHARPRPDAAAPGRGPALAPVFVPLVAVPPPSALHPGGGIDRPARGWLRIEGRDHLAGYGAALPFELPYRPAALRLSIELGAVERARRATVSLEGWELGSFAMEPHVAAAERRDIWLPPECLQGLSPCLELSFDPPDRSVACRLETASLQIGPEVPPVAIPPMDELMACFASLGSDCELGFVQRRFGAEPLGLFRFAGCDSRLDLLRLLETDFAGMGAPGSLSARVTRGRIVRPDGQTDEFEEFYMTDRDRHYGFHTWKGPADDTEAEALAANERKLAYLVRKTIEDLEDGEKIWVYKDPRPVADLHQMFALFHALGRKGPNKLFWVTRMVEGRPPGAVEWVAPNLLRGYSDQPHQDAQSFDAAMWRTLCTRAYRAFAECRLPRAAAS